MRGGHRRKYVGQYLLGRLKGPFGIVRGAHNTEQCVNHGDTDKSFQIIFIDSPSLLEIAPRLSEPVRPEPFVHPCHTLKI
jgi:hypothetical protein